ncbi:MAG: hypothetical protein GXO74_05555 [Calditrichaeota bacterium]|nr:hypothetical protein [Calditrichota bacterium]
MKKIAFFLIISALFGSLYGAGNDNYVISQKGFLQIAPVFQSWSFESNYTVSETTLPLSVYFPVNRQLSLSLRSNQATVGGDVNQLSGLTDTQLQASYHLENMNLVLTLGMNIPSGKKELTTAEFQTSALISYTYLNFRVPNLGQGFNLSPGFSWAAPLGDKFVLGLGATYQLKGGFNPLKNMPDPYNPGDEILATLGFDIKLSRLTSFALDFIYTKYGEDKIGNLKVFNSGDKFTASWQVHTFIGMHELRLIGRYRSRGKNSYYIGGIFQAEPERTTPDELEGIGYFNYFVNPKFSIKFLGEGRSFYATSQYKPVDLGGFGISPAWKINDKMTVPLTFKYFFGDIQGVQSFHGLEASAGIIYVF